MTYALERLDVRSHGWPPLPDVKDEGTVFQTPAWLAFLSRTQHGVPVVGVLRDGRDVLGYFVGLVVRKLGLRILGSPFPGWSTDYMGFILREGVDRREAVRALVDFAFGNLGCIHVEMMDRSLSVENLEGLDGQYRLCHGFELDLTRDEEKLFAGMTSACRRCIRKAEREGIHVEEAHDMEFAKEYYAQLQDVFAKQHLMPTYGIERVRQLITHVHPTGHLLLLRARNREGHCVATGIFPHLNGVLYFWGGASWRRYQALRPNEAIQWEAMRIGKRKGLRIYNMGGGGEYKRKYGGSEIQVPWFRKSKYPWIRVMRDLSEHGHKATREWFGRFVASQA